MQRFSSLWSKRNIVLISLIAIFVCAGILVWKDFERKSVNQNVETAPQEKTIEAKTDFYEITAKYPTEVWDKDVVMEKFVTDQVNGKKEEWKVGGEIYNEEKDIENKFPDRPKMVYTFDINYQKFQSEKNGTVSYLFVIGSYTGGANGNEQVQTFTFNKNGLVDIESILNLSGYGQTKDGKNMGNDLAISYLLFEKAKTDTEKFPNEDMIKEGLGLSYLDDDGVTLNHEKCNCDGWLYASNLQNFVLTDSGVEFYFGKCAVTICASGSVGVLLDWQSLKPYLVNK